MDTVDRIFDLLDKTGMEQREFAALVGVSDDTASDWRRRRSGSYAKKIAKIAEVLNTTPEYLLTGQTTVVDTIADDPLLAKAKEKFSLLTDAEKLDIIEAMIQKIAER